MDRPLAAQGSDRASLQLFQKILERVMGISAKERGGPVHKAPTRSWTDPPRLCGGEPHDPILENWSG